MFTGNLLQDIYFYFSNTAGIFTHGFLTYLLVDGHRFTGYFQYGSNTQIL